MRSMACSAEVGTPPRSLATLDFAALSNGKSSKTIGLTKFEIALYISYIGSVRCEFSSACTFLSFPFNENINGHITSAHCPKQVTIIDCQDGEAQYYRSFREEHL